MTPRHRELWLAAETGIVLMAAVAMVQRAQAGVEPVQSSMSKSKRKNSSEP
jgi:hypothetical protein